MTDISFDLLVYLRTSPNMTLESGILLGQTLVATTPKTMPAHVKRAAHKLAKVADAAQQALATRQKELAQSPEETARDIDLSADQAWSALRDVLDALGRLPATYDRARKAKALLGQVFPESTSFLRLPYSEQYVQMDTILRRIDEGGLAKSIDAVAGPELLLEIRAVHPRYAAMVARRLRDKGPSDSLLEHLRAIQRSVIEYATAVASTVDSDDPHSVALALDALRPIDNHRQQVAAARRPESGPQPDPAPHPALPTEPPAPQP